MIRVSESRRWCECGTGIQGEWTCEGKLKGRFFRQDFPIRGDGDGCPLSEKPVYVSTLERTICLSSRVVPQE